MREAVLEDVEFCIGLARKFYDQSPWVDIAFNAETVANLMRGLIENPDGLLLVTDDGMIGATLAPLMFNHSRLIAYEMFWWAEGSGLTLIKGFEDWAEKHNAIPLMVRLDDAQSERLDKVYRRRSYTPAERYYRR